MMNCAMCGIHACKNGLENAPKNCPSLKEEIADIKELYKSEENYTIAKISAKLSTIWKNKNGRNNGFCQTMWL